MNKPKLTEKYIQMNELIKMLKIAYRHIYIRPVNDYPISFVLLFFHCKFNNQRNRKTKAAFDEMTKGPFDVYPCLFIF